MFYIKLLTANKHVKAYWTQENDMSSTSSMPPRTYRRVCAHAYTQTLKYSQIR